MVVTIELLLHTKASFALASPVTQREIRNYAFERDILPVERALATSLLGKHCQPSFSSANEEPWIGTMIAECHAKAARSLLYCTLS